MGFISLEAIERERHWSGDIARGSCVARHIALSCVAINGRPSVTHFGRFPHVEQVIDADFFCFVHVRCDSVPIFGASVGLSWFITPWRTQGASKALQNICSQQTFGDNHKHIFLKQFHSPQKISHNLILLLIYFKMRFNLIFGFVFLGFTGVCSLPHLPERPRRNLCIHAHRYIIIINSNDTFINCFFFFFYFLDLLFLFWMTTGIFSFFFL